MTEAYRRLQVSHRPEDVVTVTNYNRDQGLLGVYSLGVSEPIDMSLGSIFLWTPTGTPVLANPKYTVPGKVIRLVIIQGPLGSQTFTFGSKYRGDLAGILANLSTITGTRDYLTLVWYEPDDVYDIIDFQKGFVT